MPVKPKRVNPLLSKIEVGKPRESVLQLPPSDHIYGVASKRSGDNAKDMLTTWQMHTPNNSEPPGLNFRALLCTPSDRARPYNLLRAMNKLAIIQGGGLNAKSVHDFRQSHTIRIAFAEPLSKEESMGDKLQKGGVAFGKKAKPSTPMDKLMHNDYMTEFESLQNSKLAQHTKSAAKIAVTHTRASLGHVHVVGGINEEQPEPFKMSRFRNVPSRLHMH